MCAHGDILDLIAVLSQFLPCEDNILTHQLVLWLYRWIQPSEWFIKSHYEDYCCNNMDFSTHCFPAS